MPVINIFEVKDLLYKMLGHRDTLIAHSAIEIPDLLANSDSIEIPAVAGEAH
jgi:hypothetical protein